MQEDFIAAASPMDIYTEPAGDPDTLGKLGPLSGLAGTWCSSTGVDVHPVQSGTAAATYIETYECQPIDFQTNGPQIFYGLRYHTRLTEPGSVAMFHEQVGFWLWEPDSHTVLLTLAIPRGQVALAAGQCDPSATSFEVTAERGSTVYGISSNPFLDAYFTTDSFRMSVTIVSETQWTYDQNTRMVLPDRSEPFDHVDRNTLTRTGPAQPNPLAVASRSTRTEAQRQGDRTPLRWSAESFRLGNLG